MYIDWFYNLCVWKLIVKYKLFNIKIEIYKLTKKYKCYINIYKTNYNLYNKYWFVILIISKLKLNYK